MKVVMNAHMAKYTSFRTGGYAKRLLLAESLEELKEALAEMDEKEEPHVFLGNGSNTLFADGEYPGTVIMMGEAFEEIEKTGELAFRAGGAALLSKLARAAAKEGLSGLEFAAGIPGSVGGAIFMNAGAYGGEIKDVLCSAEVLVKKGKGEYELETIPVEELRLSYRNSALQETGDIVCFGNFVLQERDPAEIENVMADLAKRRNDKQPLEYPSAGSFFKRPPGHFAGRLIEDANLKGLTVGGAQVSQKHAGFVINLGDATAGDIISLMHLVQDTVLDKFGVLLEPEVRIIGL